VHSLPAPGEEKLPEGQGILGEGAPGTLEAARPINSGYKIIVNQQHDFSKEFQYCRIFCYHIIEATL